MVPAWEMLHKSTKIKPIGPTNSYFKKSARKSSILGSKRPCSSSRPAGASGGLRPTPAPVGFEEEDGRFDPQIDDFRADFLKSEFLGPLESESFFIEERRPCLDELLGT